MDGLLPTREDYLLKKLSHLLFELLECPRKKELLYLGLCYCQLSRVRGVEEVSLSDLKECLRKYLVDFEEYPWRDYLLELELFCVRENDERLIKGRGLFTVEAEEAAVSIDPRYGPLKQTFCDRLYRYWYLTRKWDGGLHETDALRIIQKAAALYNEGLYRESLHYLDDYLSYLNGPLYLLAYRLLRGLAFLGENLERGNAPASLAEVERLLQLLKDFKRELSELPFDLSSLKGELKALRKNLRKKGAGRPPLLRPASEKREGPLKRLLKFFKGRTTWR
ncbi:MAG: hypothetical protein GXO08_05085 [Aquificae bacterium]|nr:hypothetical protein [Aquificota bacterium]